MSNAMTTDNNHQQSILIVDDDLNILEILEARLTSKGYHIFRCEGGEEALQIIKSNGIDLMISDMKMPGMSGMELFDKARQIKPDLPIIFITAYGTIPDAVKAVKAGAADYLGKPFDGKELIQKVRKHLKWTAEPVSGEELSPVIHDSLRVNSPVMKKLYEIVEKVARSNVNVLILGESGVGKERIARMVHELSARQKKPFVVVDCGSTPAGLLESELFGHVRGAFTHAVSDKK